METADAAPPAAARRVRPTMVVASIVTALVIVPLLVVSLDARDAIVVADGLSVSVDGDRRPLDGAVFEPGAAVVIDADGIDDVIALAWALAPAGADPVDEGTVEAAPFTIVATRAPIDGLAAGRYDLLVTATTSDGTTLQRAARFVIEDPS